MLLRRRRLLCNLSENEIAPTVTVFPLLGVGKFYTPDVDPNNPYSQSSFIPDAAINPHPRYCIRI